MTLIKLLDNYTTIRDFPSYKNLQTPYNKYLTRNFVSLNTQTWRVIGRTVKSN